MGSALSSTMGKVMDDNMKKQQEFMLRTQKMQLGRQIQMQLEMRQRMIAQQLARSREAMYWYASFYGLATLGLTAGFLKTKKPSMIAPLIPFSFIVGYLADMAWGNKMERIIAEADNILEKEQHLLALPGRPLSIELIDENSKKTSRK